MLPSVRANGAGRTSKPYAFATLTRDAGPPHRAQGITYNAAVRAWERGWQHQHTLHLLWAMRRHAIAPDAIVDYAAIHVRGKSQQHWQTLWYCGQRGGSTMPSCRR